MRKKLLLLYLFIGLIVNVKSAQQDGIRLRTLNNPKAAKCTWKQNRPPSEFTDPTKQIAGLLIFWDTSGKQIRSIDYNPMTREVRYINKQRQTVRKAFHRNTFKAIGTELGLDVTNMDETECNESIAAWLPQSEPWCIVQ